jgi:hypothetical protein
MTLLLLVPWMLVPGCPHQQDKQPQPKVAVTVVVILASDRCPFVDPRLKDFAVEIQKKDKSLTGFTLLTMTQKSLPAEEKAIFPCMDDCEVHVIVKQCPDKMNRVCLAVTAPQNGEIEYRCVCGKFLPIVTRYLTCEKVPPVYVAVALGYLCSNNPTQRMMAIDTLNRGRGHYRLIVAISAQPCNGK